MANAKEAMAIAAIGATARCRDGTFKFQPAPKRASRSNVAVSAEEVENVVGPPRNPVTTRSRTAGVNPRWIEGAERPHNVLPLRQPTAGVGIISFTDPIIGVGVSEYQRAKSYTALR
jgi:hypothetical protein